MPDWCGFLAMASRLKASQDEADLRTSISRAYYAAHNDAKRFILSRDRRFNGDDSHGPVWRWFGANGVLPHIGNLGLSLRKQRCKADYDDPHGLRPSIQVVADDVYEKCERIIADLDQAR